MHRELWARTHPSHRETTHHHLPKSTLQDASEMSPRPPCRSSTQCDAAHDMAEKKQSLPSLAYLLHCEPSQLEKLVHQSAAATTQADDAPTSICLHQVVPSTTHDENQLRQLPSQVAPFLVHEHRPYRQLHQRQQEVQALPREAMLLLPSTLLLIASMCALDVTGARAPRTLRSQPMQPPQLHGQQRQQQVEPYRKWAATNHQDRVRQQRPFLRQLPVRQLRLQQATPRQ